MKYEIKNNQTGEVVAQTSHLTYATFIAMAFRRNERDTDFIVTNLEKETA